MLTFIIALVVGIILIVIGISNIKGNISSIHSYHIHRVSEQDKPVFGKLMGIGTILCGISIIVFAILFVIADLRKQPMFVTIGSYVAVMGLATGILIIAYATIKYNKGIF